MVKAVVSVEKRVVKRFFVPDSELVKHEHLLRFRASENHLLIEHQDIPEDTAVHMTIINLLKCMDVDE